MVVGELVALLTTVAVPASAPEVAGLKLALNVVDCPAARVKGKVSPLCVKPAPATVTCERVIEAFPVLVRVTDCDLLVWTVTLPNATEFGLAVS